MNTLTGNLPPDPEGKNDERAEWANTAINAFAEATRMDTAGEDNATILGDLLTDLMHWCDRQGIVFEQKLLTARINYSEETRP